MGETLKELNERINSAPRDNNPVTQIVQVLNMHLTTLQRIDQTATLLQSHLNDIAQRNAEGLREDPQRTAFRRD